MARDYLGLARQWLSKHRIDLDAAPALAEWAEQQAEKEAALAAEFNAYKAKHPSQYTAPWPELRAIRQSGVVVAIDGTIVAHTTHHSVHKKDLERWGLPTYLKVLVNNSAEATALRDAVGMPIAHARFSDLAMGRPRPVEDIAVERMNPGDLRAQREALGLSQEALAEALNVRRKVITMWEAGGKPIPYRVASEMAGLRRVTFEVTAIVRRELQAQAGAGELPVAVVYRTDSEVALRCVDMCAPSPWPQAQWVTAQWWRTLSQRACDDVPGARCAYMD